MDTVSAWAWVMLAVFFLLGGFRGVIAWALLILVFSMLGCASYTDAERDQQEYDRVDWVETQFKPAVNACYASGGYLVYTGPSSQRMRRILDTQDWSQVRRSEWLSFACASRS